MQLVAYVKLHKCTTPPPSIMNHHVVCIGWEQGYKHVSRIPPLSVFSDQQPCQVIGKKCLGDKSSTATGLVWETTVPFVSLFWSTSMTAVTSRENTLLTNLKQSKPVLNLAYPHFPALGTRCIFYLEFWLALRYLHFLWLANGDDFCLDFKAQLLENHCESVKL